jgi:hypothetical protein
MNMFKFQKNETKSSVHEHVHELFKFDLFKSCSNFVQVLVQTTVGEESIGEEEELDELFMDYPTCS